MKECLNSDPSPRVEDARIPQEHLELLEARRGRVASGESTLHDWDDVKHRIGKSDEGRNPDWIREHMES